MPVKSFLFDKSRSALKASLESVGDDAVTLDALIKYYAAPGFDPGDGTEFNNPWDARVFVGEEPVQYKTEGVDLGYGIPLIFPDRAIARRMLEATKQARSSEGGQVLCTELTPMTAELAPEGQHWCASGGSGYSFGTRAAARRLIGAQSLEAEDLRGDGVNVFVVDQGFSSNYLVSRLKGRFGGGVSWVTDGQIKAPGGETGAFLPVQRRHGAMLLRSIVDLAPLARVYDFPLIPRRITGSDFFGLNAVFAFWVIRLLTKFLPGRWVIVNAWGLVDRYAETVRGDYSNNRHHWLNVLIANLGIEQDVIFAAGNNGQFCGDPRAKGYDLGPGRSIFGANGLPEVYSVGAVRTDGSWVGAASQGPGPTDFADTPGEIVAKPDFAVPSWFNENQDAYLRSGGTSSSAAVLGGALAALRSHQDVANIAPAALRAILGASTRRTNGPGWSRRTGTGILNVANALPLLIDTPA